MEGYSASTRPTSEKKKVGRRRMYGTTTDATEPPTTRWHARDQGRLKLPRSHALKKEEKKKGWSVMVHITHIFVLATLGDTGVQEEERTCFVLSRVGHTRS